LTSTGWLVAGLTTTGGSVVTNGIAVTFGTLAIAILAPVALMALTTAW
jgi:hypothetical protein